MAIDSKFQVLTKEALKNKVSNLDSSWTTILINGDQAYSKGADAGLADNQCVNADLLKEIITGNQRYEAKAEDNFLLDGDYYTLKNINEVNVSYALKQVLDFIALQKKPYTVEFIDGSTVLYTQTIYWNSKVTKPTDPTKSGYTFTGWTPSWDFNTDTLNNKNQLTSGKLVFTAQWSESSYTLTYYRNYPTGDTSTSQSYSEYGNTSVKTLSNVGFSTPSGYYFVEWNTNTNGTGTSYSPGNTINVNANTNLYAIWEEETVSSYTYTIENRTGRNIVITIDGSSIAVNNNADHVVNTPDSYLMLGITTSPLSGYRFRINGSTYSTAIDIREGGTYTITETGDHSNGGYLDGPIAINNLTNYYMGDYPNQVPGKNVSFDFTINYYTSPTSSMSTYTLTTTPGYTVNWVDAANIYVDENHKPTYSISSPPSGSSWRLFIGSNSEGDYDNYELLPSSGTFEIGYYQDSDSWYVKLSENQPQAICEINAF